MPASSPQSEETTHLVSRLRDDVLPGAVEETDVRFYVGGQTATDVDMAAKVGAALPVFIGAVVLLSFVPMMFAILFGLSMDHEVFLLSRIREEHLSGRDNDGSIVTGMASTARVITSAALIMIAVLLSFLLNDDPTVKMVGLGLATAVAVDARIARMILVPSSMALMGEANWWLLCWLERLLPRLDIEVEAELPSAEVEVVREQVGV